MLPVLLSPGITSWVEKGLPGEKGWLEVELNCTPDLMESFGLTVRGAVNRPLKQVSGCQPSFQQVFNESAFSGPYSDLMNKKGKVSKPPEELS